MNALIIMSAITIQLVCSTPCTPLISSFPTSVTPYLSARKLSLIQQQAVLALFSNNTFSIPGYILDVGVDATTIYISEDDACPATQSDIQINGYMSLWVCLSGFQAIQCNQQWTLVIQCGSYLQLHYPFNQEVLLSVQVASTDAAQIITFPLHQICAGAYQVWLVYKTRVGKVIKAVASLYVQYPSCTC